jgi:hypothetical protein
MPGPLRYSSASEDSASSGLWWKIPLLGVAVPLLIVGYAYANKDGAGGGRYKGYNTYNSTYRS